MIDFVALWEIYFLLFLFWGAFVGSGTVTAGFRGKFQHRTPRFRDVSRARVPKIWYTRFFAERLAKSKVQIFAW